MRFAWVVLCLFGCGASSPPPAPIAATAPPVAAPAAPTCEATATHLRDVYTPEGTGDAARTAALARCDTDHWGDHARQCFVGGATVLDIAHCFDQLTDAQAAAFKTELALAVHDGAADGLPPACGRYDQAIRKLEKCDKIPLETRIALREAFRQAMEAWASVPPEGREALEAMCGQAADAVEQSAPACH